MLIFQLAVFRMGSPYKQYAEYKPRRLYAKRTENSKCFFSLLLLLMIRCHPLFIRDAVQSSVNKFSTVSYSKERVMLSCAFMNGIMTRMTNQTRPSQCSFDCLSVDALLQVLMLLPSVSPTIKQCRWQQVFQPFSDQHCHTAKGPF